MRAGIASPLLALIRPTVASLAALAVLTGTAFAQHGPPLPEGRCDCPCAATAKDDKSVPCRFDLRFVSFTHLDGPFGDKKAELSFAFETGSQSVGFNYEAPKTGEGVTRIVDASIGDVRLDCAQPGGVTVEIRARERDGLSADERATKTITIPASCPASPELVTITEVLELRRTANSSVKHRVQVVLQLRALNPACFDDTQSLCPAVPAPPDYDPTPKPCVFLIDGLTLEHVSGPSLDQNGEFHVQLAVGDDGETGSVNAEVGETAILNMDPITQIEVPCCQSTSVKLEAQVSEVDAFVNDYDYEALEIPLTCPGKDANGDLYTIEMELRGRNGKGEPRHRVDLQVQVTEASVSSCVVPPLPPKTYPCVVEWRLLDVTHTDSPGFDKNGEFRFDITIGTGVQTDYVTGVQRGETVVSNGLVGAIEIPCGESRTLPVQIAAAELDGVWFEQVISILDFADEQAAATDVYEVSCPPSPDPVIRSYDLEFVNERGKVRHRATIRIEQRLRNGTNACECVAVTPETCDLEILFDSFHHDAASIGDDPGDFSFDFWLNQQFVWVAAPGSSYLTDVDKGETRVVDGPFNDPWTFNLLGTWYESFVRLPVGYVMPLEIEVNGKESDFFGDDVGFARTELKLHCGILKERFPIPISFEGRKKTKHTGTLWVLVRGL